MTRDEIIGKLRASEDELHALGLGRLFLFGSAARGAPDPGDVDLAFETGGNPHFSLLSQAAALARLEEILESEVDLVLRDSLHPAIRGRVEAEMVEVF